MGTVSTFTTKVKVGSALTVPPAYVERRYIAENVGGKVVVSYSVRRKGADPAVPSETVQFDIGLAGPSPSEDFGSLAEGQMMRQET